LTTFPVAICLISWSKYVDSVSAQLESQSPGWGAMVKLTGKILREGDEIGKRMEVVGEEGIAMQDMITYLKSELFEFAYLQQNAFDKEDSYCPLTRQIVLFQLIQRIFETPFKFDSQDGARQFFLELQMQVKNLNFMAFKSTQYEHVMGQIEKKLNAVVKKELG